MRPGSFVRPVAEASVLGRAGSLSYPSCEGVPSPDRIAVRAPVSRATARATLARSGRRTVSAARKLDRQHLPFTGPPGLPIRPIAPFRHGRPAQIRRRRAQLLQLPGAEARSVHHGMRVRRACVRRPGRPAWRGPEISFGFIRPEPLDAIPRQSGSRRRRRGTCRAGSANPDRPSHAAHGPSGGR